ncbi:hypothetical protein NEOLI_004942 [Neolecta irregularis DAH-3]|uniref:Uncharacterized protein n=1 Tax=Neolecta irregularis (strain DAH-3) TaxID=1198029 RepID=A0A1U7LLE7_NEOID|nr:hypothetical protein NEOLI_004942 [Neolecta irregularis DAH-3]|eukprot:OLL23480.1 hypothetical protein NEOLI_004942 [Neolecta irregularis DAH-3]
MQFSHILLLLAPYVIATNWLDLYTPAQDGGMYRDIPAILIKKLSYVVPLYKQDADYLASWNSAIQFCAKACTELTETHDPCHSFQIEFPTVSSTPERIFSCNTFRLPVARDLDSQVVEPSETENIARVTFTLADTKFFIPEFENKLYRGVYDFNTWINNLGPTYNIHLDRWSSKWKHNDILHRHLYPTFPSRFLPSRNTHQIMQALSTLREQNSSPVSHFEILSSYLPILASFIDEKDGESFSVTVGKKTMRLYSVSWVGGPITYYFIFGVREYTFQHQGKQMGVLGLFVAQKQTEGAFADQFWPSSFYFPTIGEEIPEPIRNQIQSDFISFLQNAVPSSWELSQYAPLSSQVYFTFCQNGSTYGFILFLIQKVIPGFYSVRGDGCLLLQDLVMNALGKVYGIAARDLDRGMPRLNPPSTFKAKLSDITIMTSETQENDITIMTSESQESETELMNDLDIAQTEITWPIFINNELEGITPPDDVSFENGFWFSSTIEALTAHTDHNQVVLKMTFNS